MDTHAGTSFTGTAARAGRTVEAQMCHPIPAMQRIAIREQMDDLIRFPFREELVFSLNASIADVFTYLDDFRRLSGHMERRSGMMIGSRMDIELDGGEGRAVGSHVRMQGTVLGFNVRLEEVVTEREPPRHKAWETLDASLIVIGQYRLGFNLRTVVEGTEVQIFIDYALPERGLARLLGRVLARRYARWCIRQMATDAEGRGQR